MAQLKDLIVTGAGRIIGKLYATSFKGDGAEITGLNASNVSSGTLSSDRLPTVPVAKGGTGATTAAAARTNLEVYAKSETYTKTEVDNKIKEAVDSAIGAALNASY